MKPFLLAVMGPTGSGKSSLAEQIASQTDAQLINADAFMVYRGFDIGTNKPTGRDRYRLLDLKDPEEDFGVGEYVLLAQEVLWETWKAGRNAIVVGGTGFYIRALFEEWQDLAPAPDPALRADLEERLKNHGLAELVRQLRELSSESAEQIDLRNPVRVRRALERVLVPTEPIKVQLPPYRKLKVGLLPPVEDLDQALAERTAILLASGWLKEVESLAAKGVPENCAAMRAIGYRTLLRVVGGDCELSEALSRITLETRQYAKRQRTWLRSEPNLRQFHSFDGVAVRDEVTRILSSPLEDEEQSK